MDRNVGTTVSELERPFAMIAFDWDGTAVENRRADATDVRRLLERLLKLDVVIAIITGTNLGHIDRQFSRAVHGPHTRNLFVLTNRGSEVWGFGPDSRPYSLDTRVATQEEDRLLTEIADAVRDELVARTGLEIGVVYNRLNRRKIDLIPLAEWQDPPKSAIGALLEAVESRLHGAGLGGGIREAFDLAVRIAKEKGLEDARITSDVKHIEIGLTDKSDSVRWLLRELAPERGIAPSEIVIAGDEFGPIAGFPGSDSLMIVPEAEGAVYFSVGPEPNGTPPGVIDLGGGPPRFLEFLEDQIRLHTGARTGETPPTEPTISVDGLAFAPTTDPSWHIVEEGFNRAREHEIESLFTVSNGYAGTRGSLAEGSSLSAPATFLAGVYASPTNPGSVPALAKAPDWMRLRGVIDGREIRIEGARRFEHRRILDLRQGLLWRDWVYEDEGGRITRLLGLRLASLADRHLLIQSVSLVPENYSGHLRLETWIDVLLDPAPGTPNRHEQLIPTEPPAQARTNPPGIVVPLRAIGTDVQVAFAAAAMFTGPDGQRFGRSIDAANDRLIERWEGEVELGRGYRLDRLVSVFTSRDTERPEEVAARHLETAFAGGVANAIADHVRAWSERWRTAAIEVAGDDSAARVLRFAAYHLISAANPEDERVSVGARALTGESYKGHVFWDTEIYMLPFYTLTHPSTARSLLMYRYHTLPAARQNARRLGYRGALFAWESAATGLETTPKFALAPDGTVVRILSGEQEHHISADVAYAVWQYWQWTADDRFFVDAGAEIVLETARFWASRGRIEEDGHYHIRHIIGPDEYHEDVDDNSFTNVMAQWNLERGVETARLLAERWPERWSELVDHLGITPDEVARWAEIAKAMYTGFDPETGLFEQFAGYFDLEEIDIEEYEPREAPMDVLLGRDRIRGSKVIKQADVVLLIYLLWDRFPPEVREANFRYYEPRCGHGSSLSPAIHGLVASRLGDLEMARGYFRQAAEIDLANNMGNAAGGVHAAALGGLWQETILGFGGLYPKNERILFRPNVPEHWRELQYSMVWRGRELDIRAGSEPDTLELTLNAGNALVTGIVDGPEVHLMPGRTYRTTMESGRWLPWKEVM